VEDCRKQLRENAESSSKQQAEHAKVLQELAGLKDRYGAGGSDSIRTREQMAKLEERLGEEKKKREKLTHGEHEATKRASELTWRLEAANCELESTRTALENERQRAASLTGDLERNRDDLNASQDEVRRSGSEVSKLAELLAQAQRHADSLADAQREMTARLSTKEDHDNRELLKHQKHKYEQKISKLYRHLSDREAYEQRLKGFIENEVDVMHKYNRELDNYCQGRRGKLGEPLVPPPPLLPSCLQHGIR